MSTTRSLFSKASAYKDRLLSDSNLELPRWRSPSPMAASIIPPPIVQSTYASPQRPIIQPDIPTRPSTFKDRQDELEADLQFLLDAQADGLAGGLDGTLAAEHISTGSTTPTALSVKSASGSGRRKRKPGIRSARKGIYNSILALSRVKGEEIEEIDEDIREKEGTIEKIDGWAQKREKLREAERHVEANEDTVRARRLRKEAEALQVEINHVELQLADMKSRQRKLLREATAAENAVQAKMATYTSSLRLLEEDVQKFLSINATNSGSRPSSSDGSVSIWQLPLKRRTLDMAKQHWTEERKSILHQRESVELEKSALDEGAVLWKDIVVQLTDFERFLRKRMATSTNANQEGDGPEAGPELLNRMDALISNLESKSDLAVAKQWNLLIAAIGAELDALRQGRQLLGGAESPSDDPGEGSSTANGESREETSHSHDDIEASRQTIRQRPRSSPEDDPDPELLFSTHDNDSE